jgi:hypothetical protein
MEIRVEIIKKLAHPGVIAVAEHGFSLKIFSVMYQFPFNIRKLGIKFINFFFSRLIENTSCHTKASPIALLQDMPFQTNNQAGQNVPLTDSPETKQVF